MNQSLQDLFTLLLRLFTAPLVQIGGNAISLLGIIQFFNGTVGSDLFGRAAEAIAQTPFAGQSWH
ncbi:hypothetical protein [Neosynechococcus sphagnicola]|uniref:hypothetical protein n=1 Tax=Neosynechococcus sphagnicola TaxID=1501145 RepID=UPI00068BEF68|nr:hypothetical protein [Neosynechococcus sphagnicola]